MSIRGIKKYDIQGIKKYDIIFDKQLVRILTDLLLLLFLFKKNKINDRMAMKNDKMAMKNDKMRERYGKKDIYS